MCNQQRTLLTALGALLFPAAVLAQTAAQPSPPPVLWVGYMELGQTHLREGRFVEAESALLAALHEAKARAANPRVLAATANSLATVNLYLGRYREAELFTRQSLQVLEAAVGPDHPDIALDLSNLATAFKPKNGS